MRQQNLAFGGIDYTPGCAPGSWEAAENVSSREYPAVVPRESRAVYAEHPGATAMYVHDKMALVVGTDFYYDGVRIGSVSPGRKQIVVVGEWLIIWPDKIYYNMEDGTYTSLELTIPIVDTVGLTASGKTLKIPGKGYVYADVGEGETITGYGDYGTLNVTVMAKKVGGYISSGDSSDSDDEEPTPMYLDQITTDYNVYIDDVAYRVLTVKKDTREFWPGVTRQYVTIEYGEKPMLGTATVYGTIAGWAHTKGNDPYSERTKATKWTLGYDYTNQVIIGTKTWDPDSYGSHYLNKLKVGDVVAFDADTMAYEKIETIERTLYTDHYYYNAIRTRRYEVAQTILNPSPETIITQNAITTADRLRLSAGNVTVDTAYVRHNDSGITFADSVAKLEGKGDITIQRIADPDLDFICAHNNRLWGVHGDTIYASKQGDPKVFKSETTTQVDPWSTEVGTDGEWTGIVSYSGSLLAFKEHVLHKVLGTLPENYYSYVYNVEGIKRGCHASAVIVGEVLYYYAPGGVHAYTGATPSLISANFGTREFGNAVGGTDGRNYYLSMQDEKTENWELYFLDTVRGLWLREDNLQVGNFDWFEGELYALDIDTGNVLQFGAGDERVRWSVTTGKLFEDTLNRRRYTRAILRADMGEGSTITVEASHDDGEFMPLYKHATAHGKTLVMPILPRRADNFRLRISGEGFVRLRGLAREYKEGSEL